MPSPEELAAIALRVATEAAALVAEGFRAKLTVRHKGPSDLVTEYDLRSEKLIRTRLKELTPSLPVVGEEEGGAAEGALVWYCDPLDGTMNFVHGHPFWCSSLGILDRDGPVAGAVVAPSLGLMWTGYRGGEARRNGEPCAVSETTELSEALVATGFPANRATAPENNFDAFMRVKQQVSGVRRCGSAAIDLCFVADGTYDAYWERRLNPWDIAGGAAVLLAAGGKLTALGGGPIDYKRGYLLASNGKLHDALLPLTA
jgi:myo-inositol-1(or 4)-monophosphatase